MRRLRALIPASLQVLGIASLLSVGMAIAAQNQDEPKAAPPKEPVKADTDAASEDAAKEDAAKEDAAKDEATPPKPAPKATQDSDPDQPANRTQPRTNNNQPAPNRTQPRTNSNQPANRNDQPANRNDQPSNRNAQPDANRGERAATEEQRAASLGAKIEAQGDQGLTVTTIEQNGMWARAGLRQNDRIVSAEGYTFTSPRQFEAWLWSQPGRQIPVIIDRGGQRYTVTLAIPQFGENSGWLGVNVDEGDADEKSDANVKGAKVTQVYPNGPASRAGLQPGDVITSINNQPIEGSADAVMTIRELQPQSTAELAVLRDKEEMKIPVVVGNRAHSSYQSFYRGQQQPGFQQGFQPGFQQGQYGNPNDQRFANQGQGNNSQFQGIPPYAMQLEHQRRMAEQNERIETELMALREEIKKLREVLDSKKQ